MFMSRHLYGCKHFRTAQYFLRSSIPAAAAAASHHNMITSAAQNGYIMPAEHGPHQCTLMAFPSLKSAEGDTEYMQDLRSEVTSIANAIARFEPVQLYSRDESIEEARKMVNSNVTVKSANLDQLWMRDTGPTFVKDRTTGKPTAMDLNFNYWGAKLPASGDETVAKQVARGFDLTQVCADVVAEGGGVEVDGEGTFMGCLSSHLNDNRNPGKSLEDIENGLRKALGVEKFIWLKGLKDDDITDYHIDALARFVRPGVVVISEPGPSQPKRIRAAYDEAIEVLSKSTDAKGRALQVHVCKEPDVKDQPRSSADETVVSYVNYLLVNGGVVLAKFGDKETDESALKLFQQLFPDRKCVQIYLNALPRTGGGIHCATQHVPLF